MCWMSDIPNECLNLVANNEIVTRTFNLLSSDDEIVYNFLRFDLFCFWEHSVEKYSTINSGTSLMAFFVFFVALFPLYLVVSKQNKLSIKKRKEDFRSTQ